MIEVFGRTVFVEALGRQIEPTIDADDNRVQAPPLQLKGDLR